MTRVIVSRFRDDVMVIGTDRVHTREFLREYIRLAAPVYKVSCEVVSSVEVPFLDILIKRHGSRLVSSPYVKPDALNIVPLTMQSGHHWHVLAAWPQARLVTLARQSSTYNIFLVAAEAFRLRFSQNGVAVPLCLCGDLESFYASAKCNAPRSAARLEGQCRWLSLGYHPAWSAVLGKAISDFNGQVWNAALFEGAYHGFGDTPRPAPRLRIAWRNVLPNVGARVASLGALAVVEELELRRPDTTNS